MKKTLTLALLPWALATIAQNTFQHSYLTLSPSDAVFVHEHQSGGYMLVGEGTNFNADAGVIFVRVDEAGDTLWTKLLRPDAYMYITSAIHTSDGGYAITAFTDDQPGTGEDAVLIKTDGNGDLQWVKSFGDAYPDRALAVAEKPTGGYLVTGRNSSILVGYHSVLMMELDANGDPQQTKTYSVGEHNVGHSIHPTADGFVLCGNSLNFGPGNWDMYVVRSSAQVDLDFKRVYGQFYDETAVDMKITADGGLIVLGTTMSHGPDLRLGLLKLSATGEVIWYRIYNGATSSSANRIAMTPDGGFLITGSALINDDTRPLMFRTDAEGVVQWAYCYGGEGDVLMHAEVTSDGGTVAAGMRAYRAWIVKTDANGMSGCDEFQVALTDSIVGIDGTLGGVAYEPVYSSPVIDITAHSYAPVEQVACNSSNTGIDEVDPVRTTLYPNPATAGSFRILMSDPIAEDGVMVMDALGRSIMEQTIRSPDQHFMAPEAPGTYFVRWKERKNGTIIRKLIVQ